jgi:hypothetical protein
MAAELDEEYDEYTTAHPIESRPKVVETPNMGAVYSQLTKMPRKELNKLRKTLEKQHNTKEPEPVLTPRTETENKQALRKKIREMQKMRGVGN